MPSVSITGNLKNLTYSFIVNYSKVTSEKHNTAKMQWMEKKINPNLGGSSQIYKK